MLSLVIQNERQQLQYRHRAGPITLGRHPDSNMPQIEIDDRYVSRRQLTLEELPQGYLRLENLGRNDLELNDGTKVRQGESGRVALPVQLRVGQTTIGITSEQEEAVEPENRSMPAEQSIYQTVSLPVQRQMLTTVECSLASLGETPSAERLAGWFETLLSVQQSAVGSTEFYEETARALVDLVGLDRGLVLLRDNDRWRIAAGYAKDEDAGLQYSQSVVSRVQAERRTYYGNPQTMSVRASLVDLEAVVASPIFGQGKELVGILFGSRDCGSNFTRAGIQPLEAQVVQLLASSVSVGLLRLQMQERLKQVEQLAAVGQAIGYIIHDLRGPLSNVQQLLEMLRENRQEPLRREEQLELIDESLAFSLDLLNDSLEFCRGVVRVDRVHGRFTELLDKHLRLLQMDLETLGVTLKIDVPGDFEVFLDPDRMARVLRNLAKNAGEAMQGQENALVTIGAREVADGIKLDVLDNGPGLPSEVQRRMFQPFGTHGKRGGTGFGLAIAQQLVEAHGGRISVVSGPEGTRFTIDLPVEPEDSDGTAVKQKTAVEKPAPKTADTTTASGRRILLAEDGLVNQRLIASLLRGADHVVTIASQGREAFEAWRGQAFDLVLMDVEMPELDGLAAARMIREHEPPGARRIPIVALTAHASDETHRQCLGAGMDAVLVKPVRSDELQRVIRELA